MSINERTVVTVGLIGGLVLAGVLLRRNSAADNARSGDRPASATPADERRPSPGEAEVARLRQRVADLERQQLEQRLAELESDSLSEGPEPTEAPENQPARAAAAPTRPMNPRLSERGRPEAPTREQSQGEVTLAYWNALNDVIAREAAMRAAPASLTAANAGGFVEGRIEAGRFASTAIQDLDATGVDPDAVALGRDLAAWYREELALSERARSLLGSSDIAARKGAAGTAWRSGEERHRAQCEAINRRGAELQARLSRKYALSFPKLK